MRQWWNMSPPQQLLGRGDPWEVPPGTSHLIVQTATYKPTIIHAHSESQFREAPLVPTGFEPGTF